jgi:HK97 family phage portal protein
MTVTPETALTLSAFFACVAILGETLGMLPTIVFEQGERTKERARNHPLYPVLHEQANAEQTAMEFKETVTALAAMRGVAYAEIVPGRRGFVGQLVPLHNDRMVLERLDDGTHRYRYTYDDGRQRTFLRDELFILRGRLGMSVVQLARETIGSALAADRFAANQWSQNGSPVGILKHPASLSAEAAKRLKANWQEAHAGVHNAGRVAVLEEGMDWTQVGLSLEDLQFLESRKFNVAEVARWFRMQAHKIGDLENATFSNIEHMGIEFVTDTVLPWCLRWEQAITRDLLLERERARIFVKTIVDALLRGDAKSRAEALEIQRRNGIISANEWRELEDRNPRFDPGGDEYWDNPQNLKEPDEGGGQTLNSEQRPGGPNRRARALAEDAARRVINRERARAQSAAVKLADDPEGWAAWVAEFYAEHRAFVMEALHVDDVAAGEYAERHRVELAEGGLAVMEQWDVADLVALALEG